MPELPKSVIYYAAIREAAGLIEPTELGRNAEYERGMRDLIAAMFRDNDEFLSDKAESVELDIFAMVAELS